MRSAEVMRAVEIANEMGISDSDARRRIVELGMSDIGARELVAIQRRRFRAGPPGAEMSPPQRLRPPALTV